MSQVPQTEIPPTTIFRHAFGVYRSTAMLAGMQLDVFTPLQHGPMTALELAHALHVRPDKLRLLLYALVEAELLTVDDDRFNNTPEADCYLVKGRRNYLGSAHELWSDLWTAALQSAQTIRVGLPQAKHDFTAMSSGELGAFLRGLHAGALAAGRQLAAIDGFERFTNLLDVGGGSGGVAIAACQALSHLRATVIELPQVSKVTQSFVDETGMADRVAVRAMNVLEHPPERIFDVAVMRALLQVLGADQARQAIQNTAQALRPGGTLFIIGHILDDTRLSPPIAVLHNLVFLNVYEDGEAYTERELTSWLAEAGFGDIQFQ